MLSILAPSVFGSRMQASDTAVVAAGTTAIARGVIISINMNAETARPIHAPRDHVTTVQRSSESAENPAINLLRASLPSTNAARDSGNTVMMKYASVFGLEKTDVLRPAISANRLLSSQS